jgi:LDH2 family malate/lactate/ureidoglycolate dehydrogenase
MHGSYEPVFGTNPLAVAIPADPEPIVLDMSTAAISFYGLVEASTAGKEIPDDVAYNAEGKPTTNPKEAMQGAIRSFDRSHKGSGLALINEILGGPLVGAAFCGLGDSKGNWGHLIYAIDPDILGDREEFIRHVGEIITRVKGTKGGAGRRRNICSRGTQVLPRRNTWKWNNRDRGQPAGRVARGSGS